MALEKYVSPRRLQYFKNKTDAIFSTYKIKDIKLNGKAVTTGEGDKIRTIHAAEIYSSSHDNPDPEAMDKILDGVTIFGGSSNAYGARGGSIYVGQYMYDTDLVQIHMEGEYIQDGVTDKLVTTKQYVDANGGKIDKIKVNGTEQTITNKEVDIVMPTMNGSAGDFTAWNGKTGGENAVAVDLVMSNDDHVVVQTRMPDGNGTATETIRRQVVTKNYVDGTFRTEAQVAEQIAEAQTGAFVKVPSYDDLPTEGAAGKIYLVPNSGSGKNVYDEYIWCIVAMMAGGGGGESPVYGYEMIGTTAIDLSGYVQESDLAEITEAEIDEMFAA